MERQARQRLRGIGALVVIVTIAVGVPAILVRLAGWPLPRTMPDWSRVRVALVQGDIPARTVVKALAVVVWLIWLQVVWALAWEFVVNVPRMSSGHTPRSAPLVASPVGHLAGRLVALVMSIGLTIPSMPSAAIALPSAPVSQHLASRPTSSASVEVGQRIHRRAVAATGWRVDKHDSLWRIAETALGDGDRANEILELNSWLRSARDVRPGQVLAMPADATVPDDRRPPAPKDDEEQPSESVGAVTYLAPAHIVIEKGDTLWDLSEDRLSIVDVHVTPRETLDYVKVVAAANREKIKNPNLIFPGEVVEFPAIGTPPPESPSPATPPPDDGEVRDALPPPPTTAEVPPVTSTPSTSIGPSPTSAPVSTDQTVPTTAPPTVTQQPPQSPSATARSRDSQSVVPWAVGIGGATVLASGLLLMYRRRLALRASRGARAYRASVPHDPTVLRTIIHAADVSLLRWANHELATLFAELRPGAVAGMPLALELSATHGLEMLWTEANPEAPRPWEATDGGWSWRLLYDEELPLPEIEQVPVLPALVTMGTRDGNQLLLNLEAVGVLAVVAPDQMAEAFARSILVEFAAGELLSDAYVACTDLEFDGASHFDRIQCCDEPTAIERLANAASATEQFLDRCGVPTMFDARLGGDAGGREATIVCVPAEGPDPAVMSVLRPGLAVCALVIGQTGHAPARVTIDEEGRAMLEPIGLSFEPALLNLATLESIEDLLDEVSEPFDEPVASPSEVPSLYPDVDVHELDDLGDEYEWHLREPQVLVRVLGVPKVVGCSGLGRIETSIVTYLACHGGQRTDDQIINAVWNGRLVEPKTLWNKISKIRSALGPELVPPRLPNSVSVTLAAAVASDLSQLRLLFARAADVSAAEAVSLLLRGLDLVQGVPFDSPDYDWAYESQHHAEACELIESAALRCAMTALDLGDIAAARSAVGAGLRALPLNEPLYRARMRIESAAGNPDGVRRSLSELRVALSARSDGTMDLEPEPSTSQLALSLASVGIQTAASRVGSGA